MTPLPFEGELDFCSNFFPATTSFEGTVYPTSEHAFQAAKTLDGEIRFDIRDAKTPSQAKRMGKKVSLRSDWEQIKLAVMIDVLASKFDLNSKLKDRLIATQVYQPELVEINNWGDRFWGVDGTGLNWLGKMLMILRSCYIKESPTHSAIIIGSEQAKRGMFTQTPVEF